MINLINGKYKHFLLQKVINQKIYISKLLRVLKIIINFLQILMDGLFQKEHYMNIKIIKLISQNKDMIMQMEILIQLPHFVIFKTLTIRFLLIQIVLKELLLINLELYGLILIDYRLMMENGYIKPHIEINIKNLFTILLCKIKITIKEIFKNFMINLYLCKEIKLLLMREFKFQNQIINKDKNGLEFLDQKK